MFKVNFAKTWYGRHHAIYEHFQRERDPRSFELVLKCNDVVYVVIKNTDMNTNNYPVFRMFVKYIRMEVLSVPE